MGPLAFPLTYSETMIKSILLKDHFRCIADERKLTTGTIVRVPHQMEPVDKIDLVPEIKDAVPTTPRNAQFPLCP